MRASREEQVGGAGVSEVSAAFERLGWGVVENARHDLGTDLFLLARDQRRFDLGLVVGVQVKAGESYFREPSHGPDSDAVGWWFRDDDRSHVDAWVAHGLPHLIVLHDLDTRTSYWVHVTADAVVSTGKGAKVLVPKANTVDEEHRDALLGVASTTRPATAWEGSAWTGAATLAPRDQLRHALVVPRLVAPHRNAGYSSTLRPEQAVALLVQARVHDVEAFADAHPDVPSLAEATTSAQWSWRFVGALGHRLTTGDVDGLLPLVPDAPDAAMRAASTVTAAAGLIEEGRADEAIEILEPALARDEAEPVDHAWLTVQLARACAEVGRLDEAHTAALDVQRIRVTHAHDVTATALAGVAAVLLFSTAGWRQQDVAGLITGADTAAAWWRTQTMSWGLSALTERTFKAWARDNRTTLSVSDAANDQLLAASLTANHVGDQAGWRHQSGLLGRDWLLRLDRDADPEPARAALATLRLAGDEDALKLAVRRLTTDGPARAVTLAAAEVRLDASTRTSGPTDLALLQHGGDLLDEVTAQRSLDWLLSTLDDSSTFIARTNPSYHLNVRLVDTLAAVLPAVPPASHRAVIDRLAALPAQQDQLIATSWARVVAALPSRAWNQETALRAGQHANIQHEMLQLPLLGIAAEYDVGTRAGLVEQARNGSLSALTALGDVRALPTEVVTDLVSGLSARVEKQIQDAQGGSFGFGGHDIGHALALLNIWHPAAANWDALLNLLTDQAVTGDHKRAALQVLGNLADQLPEDIRLRLQATALTLAGQPASPRWSPFGDERDALGAAAYLAAALGALNPDQAADRLINLLAGDADHRQWAALVAGRLNRPEDTGVLITLAQDQQPAVRAVAAAGLASMAAAYGGGLAAAGLRRCLRDPGTRVPASIAAALAGAPTHTPAAQDALMNLRQHASAYVRATAAAAAIR